MAVNSQEPEQLRQNIANIYQSINAIQQLDATSISDKLIVEYIQYLQAIKTQLTSQITTSSGQQIPANVSEALQAAETELKNVLRNYEQRNQSFVQVLGGMDQIAELRRREIGRNPTARIKQYLDQYPTIPGGANDYLLLEKSSKIVKSPETEKGTKVKDEMGRSSPLKKPSFSFLYVRNILNNFPNWKDSLDGTTAQRNPQDSSFQDEEMFVDRSFMSSRLTYWLTNRQMYVEKPFFGDRFIRLFSAETQKLQILRDERADTMLAEYDEKLPMGLNLNEPFLYLANVNRTFEEYRPFIDRFSGQLLTNQQVQRRLKLLDTKEKAEQMLKEIG